MKVRFLENVDHRPTPAVTIAYKAGMELTVKRACGEAAIAAGRAIEVAPTGRVSVKQEVVTDGDQ